MEDACEITYIGEGYTLVRPYPGAAKVKVLKGKQVSVPKTLARQLLHDGQHWEFFESKGKKDDK